MTNLATPFLNVDNVRNPFQAMTIVVESFKSGKILQYNAFVTKTIYNPWRCAMKRYFVLAIVITAFGVCNIVQAQFKNPKNGWGLAGGGAHGTNVDQDEWVLQLRGHFQYEIIPERLLGQLGLGYVGLVGTGVYSAYTGTLDVRALYTPFSIKDLNPYVFGGFGVAKVNKNNSAIMPMIPIGVGAQTKISNGILLDINGGYSIVLSDNLDGIARSNNNKNSLTNGKHDGYYGFTVGLTFSLGKDEEEVDIKKRELDAAEARRVKELAAAEAVRVKQKADAEAVRVKQKADADAALAKQQADSDAAAKLAKAAAEADARLLAAQKGRDTVIVLAKGKSVVLRGVNFEFNKSTLVKDSETILWRAYNALVANPNVSVVITGHTDNIGTQESNQKLSLERAQTVRNWLVEKGIASSRMRTFGRGQNEPVSTNDTDEGRAQNRRIEFFVEQ
jgi:outer membrane protein OmpA-like peptidoglycan-associated protein